MLIGIYTNDKYELCEAIIESVQEFMQYVGCSIHTARYTISKVRNHKRGCVIINGRKKRIEFIEEED